MKYRITVETLTDRTLEDIAARGGQQSYRAAEPIVEKLYEQTVDYLDIRQVIAAVNPQTQPATVSDETQAGIKERLPYWVDVNGRKHYHAMDAECGTGCAP